MTIAVLLLFSLLALAWAVYAETRRARPAPPAPRPLISPQQAALQRRLAEAARLRRVQQAALNQRARALQVALLRLEQAPDFRRAASFVAHAQQVPLAFRQRQFRRFRSRLVEHMAARLAAGEDRRLLVQSLTQLVTGLGIAAFEAAYLCHEADRRVAQPPPQPTTFAQRLQSLKTDHDQRIHGIRQLAGLDPEVREQLIEAEQERFHETILHLDHASEATHETP